MQTKVYRQKRKRSMPPQRALSIGQGIYPVRQKSRCVAFVRFTGGYKNKCLTADNKSSPKRISGSFPVKWVQPICHSLSFPDTMISKFYASCSRLWKLTSAVAEHTCRHNCPSGRSCNLVRILPALMVHVFGCNTPMSSVDFF